MIRKNLHFSKRFLFVLISFFYCSISLSSQNITIVTEENDATYEKGQLARFAVTSVSGGTYSYQIYYGTESDGKTPATPLSTGSITLTPNNTDYIEYSINKPGVISCRLNNDSLIASAVFSPLEIEPIKEIPTDFVQFWEGAKTELNFNYTSNRTWIADNYENGNLLSKTYLVEIQHIDNRTIYGYLTIPEGDGLFPAVVQLPPAGNNLNGLGDQNVSPSPDFSDRSGAIFLYITIHNAPPTQNDPNADLPNSLIHRDSFYYKQAVLAGVRAIDYMYDEVVEFNGEDLGVIGVSQGGGLAIMVAGVDDRVKFLMASNPMACEPIAKKYEKASGYPYFWDNIDQSKDIATQEENLEYYNTVTSVAL